MYLRFIFINILEDVKALSLPGTYHEKVVCLGNSLRKFSRLKALDLSRNSIASLQVTFKIHVNVSALV